MSNMLAWIEDPNGRPFPYRQWTHWQCRFCVAIALRRVTGYARVVSPAGVA